MYAVDFGRRGSRARSACGKNGKVGVSSALDGCTTLNDDSEPGGGDGEEKLMV